MVVWLIVWYMHANWPCSHWELHCFLTITTKNEKNGNRTGQSRYIGLVGLMKRKEKEVQNCSQRKPELSNFLILWSSKVWRKEFTHYSEWVIIIVSKFLRLPLDCWKLKFFYIASDFKWTFFRGGGTEKKLNYMICTTSLFSSKRPAKIQNIRKTYLTRKFNLCTHVSNTHSDHVQYF